MGVCNLMVTCPVRRGMWSVKVFLIKGQWNMGEIGVPIPFVKNMPETSIINLKFKLHDSVMFQYPV